jgi:hypothetical protein
MICFCFPLLAICSFLRPTILVSSKKQNHLGRSSSSLASSKPNITVSWHMLDAMPEAMPGASTSPVAALPIPNRLV